MGNGLFIAIEGAAGAGTATQLNLLKERLQAVGYDVATFDFPGHAEESAYFIKKYLAGEFGAIDTLSPYTVSLFYALDRYAAAKDIKTALVDDKIVLASCYTGSTMAAQASKFNDDIERRSFFVWADNLEFQLLGIPRPNTNFYLRLPAEVSSSKIKGHEPKPSKNQLRKSLATYDLMCQLFPKDFKAIECTKNNKMLGVAEINNLIWEQLKPLLPAKKTRESHSVVVTLGMDDEPELSPSDSPGDVLEHRFKDASLLLRLHLQRFNPQALSQSFDGWKEGDYRFYIPGSLPKDIREKFHQSAEQLSVLHQQLSKKIEGYIERSDQLPRLSAKRLLQPVIPLGALSDFSLRLRKNEIHKVATSLLASDLDELQWAAKQLYLAARHKWPKDFARPLETQTGPIALNNIIAKMAGQRLPSVHSLDESIKLLEARPKLEFDLLAESIYPYSNLSLDEISEEISDWPYSQKYQSLKEAASQADILAKVTYKLDILSDHIVLNEVATITGLRDIQLQSFTPRYGYDVPTQIELAAADDLYDAIFDESLKLYSLLQSADREAATPYATLLGHKLRWQISATAADLAAVFRDKDLLSDPTVKTISEKLAEAHPLLWEIITNGQAAAPTREPKGKARVKQSHRSSKKRGGKPKKS